jgi:hypothetical protein
MTVRFKAPRRSGRTLVSTDIPDQKQMHLIGSAINNCLECKPIIQRGIMAGSSAERQETGLIRKIKDAISKNKKNPITLIAGTVKLSGVIGAEKFSGRQTGGSEPYTDVVLSIKKGKKIEKINLSLKGESAPSLAGGGLKGLELAVPGIAKKFMTKAYDHLVKKLKLKVGDKVPDVYGKIPDVDKVKIVVGNVAMGGPIDYMYIGPMDVQGSYDDKKNVLVVNGNLHEAKNYAKSHNLYFRLRARREDQRFDPAARDGSGTPKIYGKSPSKGDSAGRIVVQDKTPANSVVIAL